MKSWWNERYINRQDWVLDHLQSINVSPLEGLILLQLETLNRHQELIQPDVLALRCNVSLKDLDSALTKLIQKGYVSIHAHEKSVEYRIDQIFNEPNSQTDHSNQDLMNLFETEFKRPLAPVEIEKLNDWLLKVPSEMIVHALREAIIYKKLNLNYIDRILVRWMNEKISVADLNAGKQG